MKCCDDKQKSNIQEINLEGLICYCFNHSKMELYEAVKNGSEKVIVDDIKSKMTKPGCFCESANPSGKCCLGDISTFIKLSKENRSSN
ncbi:MAG: hypothetical protein HOE90_18215 [Bacteriovoracaceae bacterium]|mgnify:FL=1|jgi:hypothetical protein|nr:hypothetical protein [Bacteriovoracaceae bacterium]